MTATKVYLSTSQFRVFTVGTSQLLPLVTPVCPRSYHYCQRHGSLRRLLTDRMTHFAGIASTEHALAKQYSILLKDNMQALCAHGDLELKLTDGTGRRHVPMAPETHFRAGIQRSGRSYRCIHASIAENWFREDNLL